MFFVYYCSTTEIFLFDFPLPRSLIGVRGLLLSSGSASHFYLILVSGILGSSSIMLGNSFLISSFSTMHPILSWWLLDKLFYGYYIFGSGG